MERRQGGSPMTPSLQVVFHFSFDGGGRRGEGDGVGALHRKCLWKVIRVLMQLHGTFSAGATSGILMFFHAMLPLFVDMSWWAWQSLIMSAPLQRQCCGNLAKRRQYEFDQGAVGNIML